MRVFPISLLLLIGLHLSAQTPNQLEEARLLERQFKTEAAIDKYKEIIKTDPRNKLVLLRMIELYCMQGNQTEPAPARLKYYQSASGLFNDLWRIDSTTADALYAKALVSGRMIEFVSVREKAQLTQLIKDAADQALKIDPMHVKALYSLAKWHDEVSSLNPAAKAAMKVFFGGLPPASSDDALLLYKKVRDLSPSFILNNLDYALALKRAGRSDMAIEVLQAQMKYPVKSSEDQLVKERSKKLLSSLQ